MRNHLAGYNIQRTIGRALDVDAYLIAFRRRAKADIFYSRITQGLGPVLKSQGGAPGIANQLQSHLSRRLDR
jgi:hypothetical protein